MSSEVTHNSFEKYREYVDGLFDDESTDVHIIKISDEIQIETQVGDDGIWIGECKALEIVVQGKDHTEAMANILESLALLAYDLRTSLDQTDHNLEVLRDAYRNVSYDQQRLIEGLVKTNANLRKKVDGLCKKIDNT